MRDNQVPQSINWFLSRFLSLVESNQLIAYISSKRWLFRRSQVHENYWTESRNTSVSVELIKTVSLSSYCAVKGLRASLEGCGMGWTRGRQQAVSASRWRHASLSTVLLASAVESVGRYFMYSTSGYTETRSSSAQRLTHRCLDTVVSVCCRPISPLQLRVLLAQARYTLTVCTAGIYG